MTENEIKKSIALGETSKVQFKRELDNQDKLAAEMIAFSNSKGGDIYFGIEDKTGIIVGLDYQQLQNINNKVATIANELVKPQIFITTEALTVDDKNILIVSIAEGVQKPYKDNNGTIWLKQGSDKRRLTDNAEIMRLFQQSGKIFVDEMIVPGTSINDISKDKVLEYVQKIQKDFDDTDKIFDRQLFNNLGIMQGEQLTLGGLLFFGKNPQRYEPNFCIKAISFVGNSIGGTVYRDNRDITGTIPTMFHEGMSFFNANLLHTQQGQDFNSVGILEISEIALQELLQNALIHRDYTKNAAIRLMIFDNRIEIVSPGCLPNSLTVEKIKLGNAAARNNLLCSYCSKLLKYRGFGSGIIRALENQPDIEFINDIEGEQFTVKIPRQQV
jgi:predicted HTH transcriptional regulator